MEAGGQPGPLASPRAPSSSPVSVAGPLRLPASATLPSLAGLRLVGLLASPSIPVPPTWRRTGNVRRSSRALQAGSARPCPLFRYWKSRERAEEGDPCCHRVTSTAWKKSPANNLKKTWRCLPVGVTVRIWVERRHKEQYRYNTMQLSSSATAVGVQNAYPAAPARLRKPWLNGGAQGNCVIPIRGMEKLRHDKLTSFSPKL